MKRLMIIMLLITLTGCVPGITYDQKSESDYEDYLNELGLTEPTLVSMTFNSSEMSAAYLISGMDQTLESQYIRYYTGYNQDGIMIQVLMPDKLEEENLAFPYFLPTYEDLAIYIQPYNDTTEGETFLFDGTFVETNDIILRETELHQEIMNVLYSKRTVDGVEIDVDTEGIKNQLATSLSSPFIYRIGTYMDDDRIQSSVYLGAGLEHDLVFMLFQSSTASLDIFYYYDYEE